MIAADSATVLVDGGIKTYDTPTFFLLEVQENPAVTDVGLRYGVYPVVFAATTPQEDAFFYQTTVAAINAKTGSGATDRLKFRNACDQVFEDYLSGLSDNSGVTFTIS